MRVRRHSTALIAAMTLALACLCSIPLAAKEKTETGNTARAVVNPAEQVGSDTCKTCHEEIYKSFAATPHWKTTFGRHENGAQGCEACHGPGKAHVEGGGDKSKIFTFKGAEPAEASKRCLTCHEYGEEHANFDRSQHNINSVSCVSCHSPHHAKEPQYLL